MYEKEKQVAEPYVFSVGEYNRLVNRLLENHPQLGRVRIRGEISGLKTYPSGHTYFSLKDNDGVISCVLFRGSSGRVLFRPRDGMSVVVTGKPNVYDKSGRFQIVVFAMEQEGIGDLYASFQRLKQKLNEEGLFDPEKKKAIPFIPRRIVAVTSEKGAVIRDMIHVLRRRYPGFSLLLVPVPVQGQGAEIKISEAIHRVNAMKAGDVIIVARGGGSMEDLQPFNEEIVARAIAASTIPVISAVGHETDFTIADFAADLRAPTPSAAAELVVPVRRELERRLVQLDASLETSLMRRLDLARAKLNYLTSRPVISDSKAVTGSLMEKVVRARMRLNLAFMHRPSEAARRLESHVSKMTSVFSERIRGRQTAVREQAERLRQTMTERLGSERLRFAKICSGLEALSPLAILSRGYCMTEDETGVLRTGAAQIVKGDRLNLLYHDGRVLCEAIESIPTTRCEDMRKGIRNATRDR